MWKMSNRKKIKRIKGERKMTSELTSKITDETCLKKVKVMKNIIYDENNIKCYNCSGLDEFCDDYKQVGFAMRYAYLNLYNGKK